MASQLALSLAFFLSGAAGLVFEVVWFYRTGLVFGNSVWAASVVLASFMGGLAVGTALAGRHGPRLEHPVRVYAWLELSVAGAGLLLTFILPLTAPLVGGGAARRLVAAFVLLLVPATAMGATLPVLVGALAGADGRFTSVLGRLYGLNTLGAVAGVVAAEVLLIDRLGVSGAAWTAAALNGAAAAIAFACARLGTAGRRPASAAPERPSYLRRRSVALFLACAFLAGAALLGLEVLWFRFVSMYVLTTTLALNLMLAIVLAAIGLGGFAAALWSRRRAAAIGGIPVVSLALAVSVVLSYGLFGTMTSGTQVGEWRRILWFAAVEAAPTSFLSGMLFTLLGGAIQRRVQQPTRASAWLTFANTLGSMCGAPLAAFVLLPAIGMERSFLLGAAAYIGIAAIAFVGLGRDAVRVRSPWFAPVAIAAAAAVLFFPAGRMARVYFPRAAAAYAADQSEVVSTREGPSETIFVMAQNWLGRPVYHRLVTNGFSMSGTAVPAMRYMRFFAYWPMLVHQGPLARALVICYGVGVTAGAVTDMASLRSIDVVEISKDVVAASDVIYGQDHHPLDDPRVRLHLEDGRYFLETTSERYDLITGEPPPPRNPGVVNIYTREYFQLIYDRLTDGGIATYWLPVARPNPGTDVDTIVRAFCDVFDDCSLWNGTPFDLMLAGSRKGMGGEFAAPPPPAVEERFTKPWQTSGLEAKLREVGFEQPEQIGATFIGDATYLRQLTAHTPPLTDNFPQRLRPVPERPSLSDPAYASNRAVAERYQTVLDPARGRDLFIGSDSIARLWPPDLRARSLPFFDTQRIINRVLWEGGHPLAQIEDLHAVLTATRLRTLPLWILGSDEAKQRIAESSKEATGPVAYARALRALSGRDYPGAVLYFLRSEQLGVQAATVRPMLIYSLAMAGRLDEARQLAHAARPSSADERHFWQFMAKTFGVKP